MVKLASEAIIAIAVCVVVIVVIAGFAVYYYDAYNKLTFDLKKVSVGDVSLNSVQTTFDFEIGNPSALPVYIPSGDFEIYVNDQYLGAGSFGSLTVPDNGQSQISVPVAFNASDVPSVVYGIITGGGSVTVTVQGKIHLLLFSVPFSSTLYNVTLIQ